MLQSHLYQIVIGSIPGNLARLRGLCELVSSMLVCQTVNLAVLATTRDHRAGSMASRYRRFQDFFLSFTLDFSALGRFILRRLPRPKEGFILAMDRTNWKFGRTHINFMVIGVVVGKVCIPLVWNILPASTKRGNSSCAQRIRLATRLLRILPARHIRVLTMDREPERTRRWTIRRIARRGAKPSIWVGGLVAMD